VRTILPGALVALGRDHPGMELMVTEIDPAGVPDALRTGALDVALVHDYDHVPTEPDPALDTEPLIEETIYLASAGAPLESAGDPIRGYRDASWIVGTPGTLCHTALRASV
jgi:DNA-binding transcriptional LysR family regulator